MTAWTNHAKTSALAPAYSDADPKHSKPGRLAAIDHDFGLTALAYLRRSRCGRGSVLA